MSGNPSRPLSPHLTIWRWGPHMLVSILHRITGIGLSTVGALVLLWWLYAAAMGPRDYATFTGWAGHWTGIIVGVGLTWAFFQKTLGGLRHLVMDMGAGYELKTVRLWATIVVTLPVLLTAAMWAYIIWGTRA